MCPGYLRMSPDCIVPFQGTLVGLNKLCFHLNSVIKLFKRRQQRKSSLSINQMKNFTCLSDSRSPKKVLCNLVTIQGILDILLHGFRGTDSAFQQLLVQKRPNFSVRKILKNGNGSTEKYFPIRSKTLASQAKFRMYRM